MGTRPHCWPESFDVPSDKPRTLFHQQQWPNQLPNQHGVGRGIPYWDISNGSETQVTTVLQCNVMANGAEAIKDSTKTTFSAAR